MRQRLFVVVALVSLLAVGSPASAGQRLLHDAQACDAPADSAALRAAAASPIAKAPCPGIRPGANLQMRFPDGNVGYCTMNFVFESRDAQGNVRRFIGTAGHCLRQGIDATWTGTDGPAAYAFDATGDTFLFGHFVYAMENYWMDFALIEVLPDQVVNPKLCYWGGPTGTFTSTAAMPAGELLELRHFGHSVLATVAEARTGYANDVRNTDAIWMAAAVWQGDSGGPVVTADGEALGVAVAIGGMYDTNTTRGDVGFVKVQRINNELVRAEAKLGLDLTMVTAPVN